MAVLWILDILVHILYSNDILFWNQSPSSIGMNFNIIITDAITIAVAKRLELGQLEIFASI